MRFQSTLLVVATKTLHLYNALEQKFDQVDWFTLRRPFDVGDRMQERLIDIVTEGAVPTVIDAYQRTMAGLVGTIKQRSSEILSIVDQQYGTYVARSMNEAVLRTS